MKTVLSPDVERGRIAGLPGDGPNGKFELLCPLTGRTLYVIVHDARFWNGHVEPRPSDRALALLPPAKRKHLEEVWGDKREIALGPPAWEHASVSRDGIGVPSWEEMCWVKDQFWEPDEWVVQFHPAHSAYVNVHDRVLHLWRCADAEIPHPPRECV